MNKVGVIGYPIGHSISPAFQQAAFEALSPEAKREVYAQYERYPVPPEELGSFIEGVRGKEWLGVNVTIPHKEAVLPLLDRLEPEARTIGAVNTIVNRGGVLWGHNTDAEGFLRALAENGYTSRGRSAAILGNGGAARAVVVGLCRAGAASVTVFGRNLERTAAMLSDLRRRRYGTTLDAAAWEILDQPEHGPRPDLLVNTTPIGMRGGPLEGESPVSAQTIHHEMTVFDAVYNPVQTPLLQLAQERGARTIGGLDMLVYQGAISFELFTGWIAPVDIMRDAARKVLER